MLREVFVTAVAPLLSSGHTRNFLSLFVTTNYYYRLQIKLDSAAMDAIFFLHFAGYQYP
jgi:hypothetical protein